MQALYGEKSSVPKGGVKPQTEEPPGSEEDGELCNDATVDTLFNSAEGVTYAFKGTDNGFLVPLNFLILESSDKASVVYRKIPKRFFKRFYFDKLQA